MNQTKVSAAERRAAAETRSRPAHVQSRHRLRADPRPTGSGFRLLLWSPAIAIILSAVAVPGGLLIFEFPLLALGYFVFALIARTGDRSPRP